MSLEHHIRQLAADALRINIWPRQAGGFQVNVSERGSGSWTVVIDDDPVAGLSTALRQRATGAPSRVVEARDGYADAPVQVDIEDVLAVEMFEGCMICENGGCDACRPTNDDDFGALLG